MHIIKPQMLHVKLFLNNVQLMELDVYCQLPVWHMRHKSFAQVFILNIIIKIENIASSGAKSCNWNSDNGGKCEDKKCSDAPRTFKT